MTNLTVIKVGGSTLSLSDKDFFSIPQAEKFKALLKELAQQGEKFLLTVGGGHTCRMYQDLLKDNGYPKYDEHYVGAAICNVNAIMLRAVLGDLAEDKVITFNDFENLNNFKFDKPVLVSGAALPGPSSDYDAAILAKHFNAKQIISMKNIDGVYSADPKKVPDAKKLDTVSWTDYLNIIGNKEAHIPGDNLPVDPIASRFCRENGIKFIVLDGRNIDNLKSAILEKSFDGTIIS